MRTWRSVNQLGLVLPLPQSLLRDMDEGLGSPQRGDTGSKVSVGGQAPCSAERGGLQGAHLDSSLFKNIVTILSQPLPLESGVSQALPKESSGEEKRQASTVDICFGGQLLAAAHLQRALTREHLQCRLPRLSEPFLGTT